MVIQGSESIPNVMFMCSTSFVEKEGGREENMFCYCNVMRNMDDWLVLNCAFSFLSQLNSYMG